MGDIEMTIEVIPGSIIGTNHSGVGNELDLIGVLHCDEHGYFIKWQHNWYSARFSHDYIRALLNRDKPNWILLHYPEDDSKESLALKLKYSELF